MGLNSKPLSPDLKVLNPVNPKFSLLGSPVVPFPLFWVLASLIKKSAQGCPHYNMATGLPRTSSLHPEFALIEVVACTEKGAKHKDHLV